VPFLDLEVLRDDRLKVRQEPAQAATRLGRGGERVDQQEGKRCNNERQSGANIGRTERAVNRKAGLIAILPSFSS